MFIDEAHTMIGAGGAAGQNDAANLLKPALARGELRTIAATTWAEYKKYSEKDVALTRRFQVVKVEEPDEANAVVMMRGIAEKMEDHHNVRILDEAIVDCLKLSNRYITGRQLPDKSISVLDTACAKVAIGQGATPGPVEDVTRRIQNVTLEIDSLEREMVTGAEHDERLEALKADRAEAEAELEKLNEQWNKEKELVEQIRTIRTKLEMSRHEGKLADLVAASADPGSTGGSSGDCRNRRRATRVRNRCGAAPETAKPIDTEFLKGELKRLNAELKSVQGENR
jgi:type VI secretion system protein VasG